MEAEISDKYTDRICDLCENNSDGFSKCVDCDAYLCNNCVKAHRKIKVTLNHVLLPWKQKKDVGLKVAFDLEQPESKARAGNRTTQLRNEELAAATPRLTVTDNSTGQDESYFKTDKLKGTIKTMKCKVHTKEDITFFCHTCKELICSDCILGNHQSHNCVKVKDAAKQKEQEMTQLLAQIKNSNVPSLKSKLTEIKKRSDENEKAEKDTVEHINARLKELVMEVYKICEELTKECQTLKKENEQYLERVKTNVEKDLLEMENLHKEYHPVIKSGTEIDKILAEQELNTKHEEKKLQEVIIVTNLPQFIPGNTENTNKSVMRVFGSVDRKLKQATLIKDSGNIDEGTNQFKIEPKIMATFKHKATEITSICPLSDNTAWIHSGNELNNDVVNTSGQIQKTVKFNFVVGDCALTTDGDIIVTDKEHSTIYRISKDGKKKGVINTLQLRPVCLCMSMDGNLLVTMVEKFSHDANRQSKRLVARINLKGQTVQTYEYSGRNKLFNLPTGIAENTNMDIVVVNRFNDTVGNLVILTKTGKLKVTYNSGPDDINFDPMRVKCDILGNIIVSDFGNKKLHLLNAEGQFVQFLMTSRDWTYKPNVLSLDRQCRLWVGCYGGVLYILNYLS